MLYFSKSEIFRGNHVHIYISADAILRKHLCLYIKKILKNFNKHLKSN